jgi:hypothetical protein
VHHVREVLRHQDGKGIFRKLSERSFGSPQRAQRAQRIVLVFFRPEGESRYPLMSRTCRLLLLALCSLLILLSYAELAEDPVKNLFVGRLSHDLAQGLQTLLKICGDDLKRQALSEI